MANGPAKIESMADVAAWIHNHDGWVKTDWRAQHRLNADQKKWNEFTMLRIQAVERRIVFFAGLAAANRAITEDAQTELDTIGEP